MRSEPEVVSHIARRIHVHPEGWEPTWKPPTPRRTSRIVFATDVVPGARGDLGLGAYVIAHADSPAAIMRGGFVIPDAGLDPDELEEVEAVGWRVLTRDKFVRGPLRYELWKGEAVLAAFDLDRVLGLVARRWTQTRDGRGLSLALTTAKKRKGGHSRRKVTAPDKNIPGVSIRAYDGRRQRVGFGSNADKTSHPASLVDLVQLRYAQSGRYPRDLSDLRTALGVPAPQGGSTPAALAGRVRTIAECYARLFARHRSLVGDFGGPGRPTSPGWYGRRWPEMMGLVPPLSRWWDDLDPRILGAIEAYHGPEAVIFERALSVPGCHLFDVLSEFVVGAINIGIWDWLVAERMGIVPLDPDEIRERIDALGRDALTNPAARREFGGVFLRFIPKEDVVPHRVPRPDGSFHMKVAPLSCPEPSLWHAFDAIRSRFEKGAAPERIVGAWALRPVGRIRGLRPLDLPWGTFDPDADDGDFFRWQLKRRIGLQTGDVDPGKAWSAGEAERTLKACVVALIGSFAQVNSDPSPNAVRTVLVSGDGSAEVRRTRRPHRRETPGAWYFPPAGAAILAEGRFTGYAARSAVSTHSGQALYGATDSVIAADLTPQAALAVQGELERLNPTDLGGPRIVASPDGLRQYPGERDGALLLRMTEHNFGGPQVDERGETYLPRVPLTFTGWHSMRYVLTDPDGMPIHWSEHGLGELIEVLP